MAIEQLATQGRAELAKVIVGQRELIDAVLIAVIGGGHVLIEGVPGLAKTLAVKSLARLLQLDYKRVQGVSDLMPADLMGANVLNMSTASFTLHRGPLFTDLLLVDEINRMPPRTQASLLEAMEERQITIDGVEHRLSHHFTVLATQNPVEFEGAYPLPEAQLDRFLLKTRINYPSAEEELSILKAHHAGVLGSGAEPEITPIATELIDKARRELRAIQVEDSVLLYIANLVRRTRNWPAIALGASPRAAASLLLVAKAYAAFDGRDYVIPDDVKSALLPTMRHRLILRPEAELEGMDTDRALTDMSVTVEVPR